MYASPEAYFGEATTAAVDMWSFGVVLYILVCGFPPFWQDDLGELANAVCAGAYDYPAPDCDGISAAARDAVGALLTVDPGSRATAAAMQDILQKWLRRAPSEDEGGFQKARQRHSAAVARLRRAAFGIIAQQRMARILSPERVREMDMSRSITRTPSPRSAGGVVARDGHHAAMQAQPLA